MTPYDLIDSLIMQEICQIAKGAPYDPKNINARKAILCSAVMSAIDSIDQDMIVFENAHSKNAIMCLLAVSLECAYDGEFADGLEEASTQ